MYTEDTDNDILGLLPFTVIVMAGLTYAVNANDNPSVPIALKFISTLGGKLNGKLGCGSAVVAAGIVPPVGELPEPVHSIMIS